MRFQRSSGTNVTQKIGQHATAAQHRYVDIIVVGRELFDREALPPLSERALLIELDPPARNIAPVARHSVAPNVRSRKS